MRWLLLAFGLCGSVAAVACSDSNEATNPVEASDAGDASDDDASIGAHPDAATEAGPTPTETTAVDADIGGVVRTLDRAQFGVTSGTATTFYLEAHEGGVAECPEKETPKRTMIVSGVPDGAPGDSFTEADGVTVSFLDFTGDQITADNPTTKAKKVKVTLVAYAANDSVEIEVDATFAEGTTKGRVYATYCDAMSE